MNMTVVYVILGVIGGYLFALLDRRVTQAFRKPRPEPESTPPPRPAADTAAEATHAAHVPAPSGPPDGLRVGRERDGSTFVEVDGMRVTPATVNVDQRRRLISLLSQLRPYVEAGAPVPPPPAPARPAAPPASAERSSQPARLDLSRGLRTFLEDSVIEDDAEEKPLSIVGQIDLVLQEMLRERGAAENAIRLMEGPGGEVLVYIGAQRYNGIDAVPDEKAQALIRAAVAAWEKTSGG